MTQNRNLSTKNIFIGKKGTTNTKEVSRKVFFCGMGDGGECKASGMPIPPPIPYRMHLKEKNRSSTPLIPILL
jgi:hypothetical protein